MIANLAHPMTDDEDQPPAIRYISPTRATITGYGLTFLEGGFGKVGEFTLYPTRPIADAMAQYWLETCALRSTVTAQVMETDHETAEAWGIRYEVYPLNPMR